MRSILVAGGVAIAGTALGILAYTVVSAPADEEGTAASDCGPKERLVGPECVQVVRVVRGGTGPTSSAPEAPAAPAALNDDDRDDDHGDDHDDDSDDSDDD